MTTPFATGPFSTSHLAAGVRAAALALALATSASAQQVLNVAPGTALSQIQQALGLASDGDVIRVAPGFYSPFDVVGKSVTIIGEPGAQIIYFAFPINPPNQALEVRGLALGQRVVVRGLTLQNSFPDPIPCALVSDCAGSVVFEDCTFVSGFGPGVTLQDAASASFVRCDVRSAGPFQPVGSSTFDLQAGLRVRNSTAFLFDSLVVGSAGKPANLASPATSDGGPGLDLDGGLVFAQGSILSGGVGGGPNPPFGVSPCAVPRDGGPGLVLAQTSAPSRVVAFDTDIVGGLGAQPAAGCPLAPGQDGPASVVLGGTLDTPTGERRTFGATGLVDEGAPIALAFVGEPADFVLLLASAGPRAGVFVEPLVLAPHVDLATYVVLPQGFLPASGVAQTSVQAPILPPFANARTFTTQALFVDASGALFLGAPSHLVVVDAGL